MPQVRYPSSYRSCNGRSRVTGEFRTASPEQTERAGEALGALVRAGDVVVLTGDLGAGKTHLVQGMAVALGAEERVTSPTFNLLLVHPGMVPLYHFDLYRLEHEDELEDIAFYETIEGDGVSAIEWGDRFPASLPPDRLVVVIHREGESSRRFEVAGQGPRGEALASSWLSSVLAEGATP